MKGIILHIPHSSPSIPFFEGFVVGRQAINNEINILTDWFTDQLFNLPYPKIVTPFSRVFCDVERFEDDSLEVMSLKGMGMCYTHMDNGETMRDVSPYLRERIKTEFYLPHHLALEELTTDLLQKYEHVIIIDCHSFPDMPLNRDLNKELPRPDFCLGIDELHTPKKLHAVVQNLLMSLGYKVLINNPYSGTMIPLRYYKKNKNVTGLMIEVNRKHYMTTSNDTVLKTASFEKIRKVIKIVLQVIKDY